MAIRLHSVFSRPLKSFAMLLSGGERERKERKMENLYEAREREKKSEII